MSFTLQVLPVLFNVLRGADDPLSEYTLNQLCALVRVVKQHIRRFLGDMLGLLMEFWGKTSRIMHYCLQVRG
jgi:FKBP12-rapamycin complex-associated protein